MRGLTLTRTRIFPLSCITRLCKAHLISSNVTNLLCSASSRPSDNLHRLIASSRSAFIFSSSVCVALKCFSVTASFSLSTSTSLALSNVCSSILDWILTFFSFSASRSFSSFSRDEFRFRHCSSALSFAFFVISNSSTESFNFFSASSWPAEAFSSCPSNDPFCSLSSLSSETSLSDIDTATESLAVTGSSCSFVSDSSPVIFLIIWFFTERFSTSFGLSAVTSASLDCNIHRFKCSCSSFKFISAMSSSS
mmetsp:Transcript_27176/g.36104  ORF Transcript_27176/g.36104 Transcript_27176/m.36104 type:complete len:251 (-) Transcript_27176:529-1281(-)